MNDVQIRIAAALDKGDFAAAQGEVDKLKASGTDALNQTSKAAGKIAEGNQAIKGTAATAMGSMSLLQMLMAGNLAGALKQAMLLVSQLNGRFASMAANVAGPAVAGAIGFALGKILDSTFGISDAIQKSLIPSIKSMKEGWDKAFNSAEKMANLNLNRLKNELQDVVDKLNETTKGADSEKGRSDRERAAAAGADIAEIEAKMPAGPERDRAVLQRRRQLDDEQRAADEAYLQKLDGAQQDAANRLAALRANADRELASEEAKTQALITRATSTGNEAAWKALGDQRRRAARLQREYAEQEKRIQDELEKIGQQQADTQSEATVRGFKTRENSANASKTESGINASESAAAAAARAAAARREMEALKPQIAADAAALEAGRGITPSAAKAAALEQSREVDGRKMSPNSRALRDRMEDLLEAAEQEAAAQGSALAQVSNRLGQMTAKYKELEAQLKTKEDF